jgi:hypothetical protein
VRSKIDLDIQNAEKDGELEIDIVEKIMSKFSDNLKHAGLKFRITIEGSFNSIILSQILKAICLD